MYVHIYTKIQNNQLLIITFFKKDIAYYRISMFKKSYS